MAMIGLHAHEYSFRAEKDALPESAALEIAFRSDGKKEPAEQQQRDEPERGKDSREKEIGERNGR